MDTRTGRVGPMKDLAKGMTEPQIKTYLRPIDPANLSRQARRLLERKGTVTISRNSRCPCGSGIRFKRCCMDGAR